MIRRAAFSDPAAKGGEIIALVGTAVSAAAVPTLFFTLHGLVGLVVFGPGGMAVVQRSEPRLKRTRCGLACVGAIGLFTGLLYGFTTGSVASSSVAGTAFWVAVFGLALAGSLYSLIRLAGPAAS